MPVIKSGGGTRTEMFQSSLDEVLNEVDDLDQEPGDDEIHEYAELIGIDPKTEPELLWIARAGITAPLPADWKPIQVNNGDELYFYNSKTGESSWEHPSDDKYRQLVVEERKKLQTKQQGAGHISKPPNAQTAKPTSASAAANKAPLNLPPPKTAKPLPSVSALGKLAPLGAKQGQPLPPSGGKLQPLHPPSQGEASNTNVGVEKKPAAPVSTSNDRPKTSRGPVDKPKQEPPNTASVNTVVGGGSRFLKKSSEQASEPTTSKEDGKHQISSKLEEVLKLPAEGAESEASSFSSDSDVSLPDRANEKKKSEKFLLDVETLQPAAAVTTTVSTKPPTAPRASQHGKSEETAQKAMTNAPPPPYDALKSQPVPSKPVDQQPKDDRIKHFEAQLQDDYEKQVKKLREQHDAKLKDVKAKFEEEEKRETEKLKMAMDERLKQKKDNFRLEEEKEHKRLSEDQKRRIDELRKRVDADSADAEKHIFEGRNREKQHEQALEAINKNYEEELKRLQVEHKRRLDESRRKLDKELEEWYSKEKERKIALMKVDLEKEIVEHKKRLQSERMASIEEEVERSFESRRIELLESYEQKIHDLRKEHEQKLDRIQSDNAEKVQKERHKSSEVEYENLRLKEESSLKAAENQLQNFRDELTALTKLAAELKKNLQPSAPSQQQEEKHVDDKRSPKEKIVQEKIGQKHKRRNSLRKAVIKSIDGLISAEGESSSHGSSALNKINSLETDDVMEKVKRFLETQKTQNQQSVGNGIFEDNQSPRSDRFAAQKFDRTSRPFLGHIDNGLSHQLTVQESLNRMHDSLQVLADRLSVPSPIDRGQSRRENVFRIRAKDAIDELVERRIANYFKAEKPWPSVRDRSIWASNTESRQFRRGDVESELNSLKHWLNDFERKVNSTAHRYRSTDTSTMAAVQTDSHMRRRSLSALAAAKTSDEEVVEI